MIKKKVLFVTSTFPTREDEQLAPWIGDFVRRLKLAGVDIEIFAPSYKGVAQSSYFSIRVYRFRYAPAFMETLVAYEGVLYKLRHNPWFYLLSFFYIIFGAIRIAQIVKKNGYDAVNVNWPFPHGLFGIIAKKLSSAKLILTFYGAEFSLVNRIPFGKIILRLIIQQADKIVSISNDTKRKICELEKVPIEVIPLTSPIPYKDINTIKQGKKDTKEKILFVGRLIERKGVSYLVDAMPKVLASIDARLDIAGEGPLYNLLYRQVREKGLEKNVFLHGKISEKKLKRLYQDCDVFVLPAIIDRWGDTEGLGVVLLEAMSFKKPVIASDVGGIKDIVENGKNGFLVREKDSNALARSIVKITKDKNLAKSLGRNGYKLLKDRFSWESIIERTLKIYSSL